MNRDLTVGKPEKVLLRFCLPLFASVIFQQLYNVSDSFVAGKFIGEDALAAVGNSYEITLIFIAVAFGCNIGCSVIVSNLFGAGKLRDLKTAVTTTFLASGVLCLLLMGFGRIFSRDLLMLIRTPDDILSASAVYLNIYLYGLPFVFFYNVSTGIFSALGDSRTPFLFLMCSSLANIGMDVLFVTAFSSVFPLGVDGVAWATFLCQGVSCLLAVCFVFRRLAGIAGEKAPVFSFSILRQIARIALPSMAQQSFISVGNILIQGMINPFGTGVIAGYAAAVKLNNLVVTSFTTLGNGISNYTAQNIGAGKFDRIHAGFKAGLRIVWLLCAPMAILYFFGGRMLVLLFLDSPSEAAVQTGTVFLKILAPFYFVMSSKLVSDGILRGSGHMKPFMFGTFVDLVLRVLFAALLSRTALASVGIWLAWPIGWGTAAVISVLCYKKTDFT